MALPPSRRQKGRIYHEYEVLHSLRSQICCYGQGDNLPGVQGTRRRGGQACRRPQSKEGELDGWVCARPHQRQGKYGYQGVRRCERQTIRRGIGCTVAVDRLFQEHGQSVGGSRTVQEPPSEKEHRRRAGHAGHAAGGKKSRQDEQGGKKIILERRKNLLSFFILTLF